MTALNHQHRHLQEKLASVQTIQGLPTIDCRAFTAQKPLVILALGQSNAGNHAQLAQTIQQPIQLVADGHCVLASAPLPGGTGRGGSVWQWLPQHLHAMGVTRPVVMSVLAVEATTINDWTRRGSLLHQRLIAQLHQMSQLGLAPNAILWQQGEADARVNTSAAAYAAGLDALAGTLKSQGVQAPVFLALSTVCRAASHAGIRAALILHANAGGIFRLGSDTDVLQGQVMRHDGCHFSSMGEHSAAQLWAIALRSTFASM